MERGRHNSLPVMRFYPCHWWEHFTPDFWVYVALGAICLAPLAWFAWVTP